MRCRRSSRRAALWISSATSPRCGRSRACLAPASRCCRPRHAQGLLTPERVWDRIQRAVDAKASAHHRPIRRVAAAGTAGRRSQVRDGAALSVRLAGARPAIAGRRRARATRCAGRVDALRAPQQRTGETAWQKLQRVSHSTSPARSRAQRAGAYHATDFSDDALARLTALPPAAQTDASREWRVRVALANREWSAAQSALAARCRPGNSRTTNGVTSTRARWPQNSASRGREQRLQRAGAEATYSAFSPRIAPACRIASAPNNWRRIRRTSSAFLRCRVCARVRILRAGHAATRLGANGRARSRRCRRRMQRIAAGLATQRGWYDRAVFTFSNDEALRLYEQRFPLASQGRRAECRRRERPASIRRGHYAILRAESAWMTDAHSAADACGLMQLLPGTAAELARQNATALTGGAGDSVRSRSSTFALGTRYLARHGRALQRQRRGWRAPPTTPARRRCNAGSMPAAGSSRILFIATIPYKETREYVARVMAFTVIYDWRLHGNAQPVSARLPAIGTAYDCQTTAARASRRRVPWPARTLPPPARPPPRPLPARAIRATDIERTPMKPQRNCDPRRHRFRRQPSGAEARRGRPPHDPAVAQPRTASRLARAARACACVSVNVYERAALRREFDGADAVINLVGILNETGGAQLPARARGPDRQR